MDSIYFFSSLFQSVTTIAIYLIVLIQFKVSLISQQMPAHLTEAAEQMRMHANGA
jgi:hypothetical protein